MPSKYEAWKAKQEEVTAEWHRVTDAEPIFGWPLDAPDPRSTVRVTNAGLELMGRLPVEAVPAFIAWLQETFE